MNKDEALNLALNALCIADAIAVEYTSLELEQINPAIIACKEALSKQELAQEPVAWQIFHSGVGMRDCEFTTINPASLDEQPSLLNSKRYIRPLYAHHKQWQGLTDDERIKCYETSGHKQHIRPQDKFAVLELSIAIEQASKEKNGVK